MAHHGTGLAVRRLHNCRVILDLLLHGRVCILAGRTPTSCAKRLECRLALCRQNGGAPTRFWTPNLVPSKSAKVERFEVTISQFLRSVGGRNSCCFENFKRRFGVHTCRQRCTLEFHWARFGGGKTEATWRRVARTDKTTVVLLAQSKCFTEDRVLRSQCQALCHILKIDCKIGKMGLSDAVRSLLHRTHTTNLQRLDLNGTEISSLASLAGLKNLTSLDVRNTQLSDQDIEQLRNTLPNCQIEH